MIDGVEWRDTGTPEGFSSAWRQWNLSCQGDDIACITKEGDQQPTFEQTMRLLADFSRKVRITVAKK